MLCSCTSALLSRLALQHAPLALALPQLARCLRGGARSLHVFARRPTADHTKVAVHDDADVGDLKDAALARLKLDVPPDCVRLLLEPRGGGAPVPLDSRKSLAEQGVGEGCSVVVEVMAAPPLLLAPQAPSLPLLTVGASPAATPGVEYRGAWGCARAQGPPSPPFHGS
jgi:hypothetical protein